MTILSGSGPEFIPNCSLACYYYTDCCYPHHYYLWSGSLSIMWNLSTVGAARVGRRKIRFLMLKEGRGKASLGSSLLTFSLASDFHRYHHLSVSHWILFWVGTTYVQASLPHICGSHFLRGVERSHRESQGRIPGCYIAGQWEKEE